MREHAAELVDLDLGPRATRAIEERLRAEVTQQRLTSLDRRLLRDIDQDRTVTAAARDPFDQTLADLPCILFGRGRIPKTPYLVSTKPAAGRGTYGVEPICRVLSIACPLTTSTSRSDRI